MNKSKKSLTWSIVLFVIGMIIIGLGYIVVSPISQLCNTVGVAILVSSIIYVILYSIELENEFNNFIMNILYEYNMLADYLTDYIYDCQNIKSVDFRLNRIMQLYTEIHNFKVTGLTLEATNLFGKRKKALQIYLDSEWYYVKMLDFFVEVRNYAVLFLHLPEGSSHQEKAKACNENIDVLIDETIEKARNFKNAFMQCHDDIGNLLECNYEHQTEYKTPV